jgi:2-polyprenyl-3-methyl-5-hydroxy-6-metoxy-1,4-benzoquinol methylase
MEKKHEKENLPLKFFDFDDSENSCFLCENPQYSEGQKISHFGVPVTFKQCQCGLIKQTPMPNERFFEWFFNSDVFFSSKKTDKDHIWGYYDYFKDEPSRMATSKNRFKKINQIINLNSGSSVMKIGPATGTFLHIAQIGGHKVRGCDVSAQFANFASKNYNVEIDVGRFEQQNYPKNSFDVIVVFNVIENVPNLNEFMNAIVHTMKPGGYLIFNYVRMNNNIIEKMQRGKYFMYRPPICYMFTQQAIAKLLRKYEMFEIASIRDIRYMTPEKVFSLLGWKFMTKLSQLLKIDRLSFPLYAYPSEIHIARLNQ